MLEQNSNPIFQDTAIGEEEKRDLGFGSVVARESRLRLLNQDGSFNVQRKGLNEFALRNLYYWLLTISWWKFLGLVLLLYFLSNIVFGLIYAAFGAESLVDTSFAPTENLLLRGFFFSVQTFATIGYGTIHPVGLIPNFVVTIESYYSLIANALVTGVVFARFARPTARVKFSEKAVVAPYHSGKGLMFRLVNMRISQLIEVEVKVLFARFVEENGRVVRRFDFLPLEREKVQFFPLSWTVVHPIDEKSPFYGLTEEDLIKSDTEILILLTAIEESFSQTVHTRTSYKPEDIVWNARFVNLYGEMKNGSPISIDVRKLSQIEKV